MLLIIFNRFYYLPVTVMLPVENIFNVAFSSPILNVTPGCSSGSYLKIKKKNGSRN